MSQPPTPFARSWSFTDFSTNNPTTPHQGQKIDLELNNVLAVLNYTISRLNEVQADDGKVRNSGLNFTTIAAAIGPILSVSIINSINSAGTTQVAAVNAAGTTQVSAVNAAGATFAATASTVSTNAAAAASSATTAEGWKNSAQASALSATNSANTAFVHKNTALAYANDAFTHSDNAASSAAAAGFSLSGCISSAGQASYEAGQANAYSVQAETSKVGALNAQSAAQSASSSASSSAISATASAVSATASAASATASASSASASASSAYNYYSAFNLSVGTVSTGLAGSQAVVTRTGTAPSYLLNFTIPAGAAGAAGAVGATGATGVIAATAPLSYNSGTQTVSIDLSAYAPEAPINGTTYGRNNAAWTAISSGAGTVTYSSPYLHDTVGAVNISTIDLGSGTLTSNVVTASNVTLGTSGVVLAASSGATITFADATTQSTAAVSGIADAPSDSKAYVRKDAAWLALVADIPDFTWYDHPHIAWTTSVVNGGIAASSVYTTNIHNLVTSATVANSRASIYTSKSLSVAAYVGQFYGNAALGKYRLNWSRKLALFSAFNDSNNGINANVNYYAGIGLPYPANFVGTFTDKGMGIQINTTAANTAQIRIIYHDGTTPKASAYVNYNSNQANNNFANNSWALFSDGNGTIKLFCYSNLQNGLAITVTDGPIGVGSTNDNVNIGASILTGATASSNTICMVMPRVYYGL